MGITAPITNHFIVYVVCKLHTYTHKSSTQDAPALRTRDGGFYDRSTVPTHPVPQILMHNSLHFLFSYIPWAGRAGKTSVRLTDCNYVKSQKM